MRALLPLLAIGALAAADGDDGSLPPVGHGGPLDHQPHPHAVTGTSAGVDPIRPLSRPADPARDAGLADGDPARPAGVPAVAFAGRDIAGSGRDRDLLLRIRATLAGETALVDGVEELQLTSRDGVITAQGTVDDTATRDRLVALIDAHEGVKKVVDHLGVGAR